MTNQPEAEPQENWGPLEVDLFASTLTNQLERFFRWRTGPEAEALDAFNHNWGVLRRSYTNPPWNQEGRVLSIVCDPGSDSPSVEVKPWCPTLLEIVVDFPTSHQDLNTLRMHSRGDASISRLVYPRYCNQDKEI